MSKKSNTFFYTFADSEAVIEIKAGENGVTQAHIDLLLQWETLDYSQKVYREEFMECSYEEVEREMSKRVDTAPNKKDPKQERMEKLIRKCIGRMKPEQQKLYYEYYGMKKSAKTLGEERGIKKQSIYGQLDTIKRNLKKMLEEYK